MHRVTAAAVLMLAACASTPVPSPVEAVQGHYRRMFGPDGWNEIDLDSEGRCTWSECISNRWLQRTPFAGRWHLEGERVAVVLDSNRLLPPSRPMWLVPRRWMGRVYLLREDDLAWFDEHGPMDGFCFHVDGAPMADPFWLWSMP